MWETVGGSNTAVVYRAKRSVRGFFRGIFFLKVAAMEGEAVVTTAPQSVV